MLDTMKINDLGNEVSATLSRYGMSGGTLVFELDKDTLCKVNEDLFYRTSEHGEGDTPQETEEIGIIFDHGFRVVFTEKEA